MKEIKVCSSCSLRLPLDSFNRATKYKDGRQHKCRECNKKYQKEWYLHNIDKRKAEVLEYRKNNPDKVKSWRKKINQTPKMKEYFRIYQLNYRKLHPDRVRATEAKRNQSDSRKHSFRLKEYRRRGAVGSHSLEEWLDKLNKYGHTCVYCDLQATTRDHKIPLIRGGTNFIENIVPACFSCNSSKGAKTDGEFISWLKK
jgi:5-methylcytosine-specific restriction endonuclease McrA